MNDPSISSPPSSDPNNEWGWRSMYRRHPDDPPALRTARRVVIAVIGSTVLLLGIVMLVLPGPGILVGFAGLGILGTEFLWARRLLRRSRTQVRAGTRIWTRWWRRFRGLPPQP